VNLMPPAPAGRRYFFAGLAVILLWLANFFAFTLWLFLEMNQQETVLRRHHVQLDTLRARARERVTGKKAFMERHGAALAYQQAVGTLMKTRIPWDEAMEIVATTLPGNASLFQLKASGKRVDGWAAFPTADGGAAFLDKLRDHPQVEGVFLDCMGRGCAGSSVRIQPDDAQILHFHWNYRVPDTVENGEVQP
jgi:hypothetical protein